MSDFTVEYGKDTGDYEVSEYLIADYILDSPKLDKVFQKRWSNYAKMLYSDKSVWFSESLESSSWIPTRKALDLTTKALPLSFRDSPGYISGFYYDSIFPNIYAGDTVIIEHSTRVKFADKQLAAAPYAGEVLEISDKSILIDGGDEIRRFSNYKILWIAQNDQATVRVRWVNLTIMRDVAGTAKFVTVENVHYADLPRVSDEELKVEEATAKMEIEKKQEEQAAAEELKIRSEQALQAFSEKARKYIGKTIIIEDNTGYEIFELASISWSKTSGKLTLRDGRNQVFFFHRNDVLPSVYLVAEEV